MTTTVNIGLPKPNHKRIVVKTQGRNGLGDWKDLNVDQVLEIGEHTQKYVYDNQRIIIEEID